MPLRWCSTVKTNVRPTLIRADCTIVNESAGKRINSLWLLNQTCCSAVAGMIKQNPPTQTTCTRTYPRRRLIWQINFIRIMQLCIHCTCTYAHTMYTVTPFQTIQYQITDVELERPVGKIDRMTRGARHKIFDQLWSEYQHPLYHSINIKFRMPICIFARIPDTGAFVSTNALL